MRKDRSRGQTGLCPLPQVLIFNITPMAVHGKKLIFMTFGPLQNPFGPFQNPGLDPPLYIRAFAFCNLPCPLLVCRQPNQINMSRIEVGELSERTRADAASGQLMVQLQSMPHGLVKPCTRGSLPENRRKNRYANMLPCESQTPANCCRRRGLGQARRACICRNRTNLPDATIWTTRNR